jgi:hypothetical protein
MGWSIAALKASKHYKLKARYIIWNHDYLELIGIALRSGGHINTSKLLHFSRMPKVCKQFLEEQPMLTNREAKHAIAFDSVADRVDCKKPATTLSYPMKGKDCPWYLKNSSIK